MKYIDVEKLKNKVELSKLQALHEADAFDEVLLEIDLLQQEQPEVDLERAKDMFIKALERAAEQTNKGYELTDCDKHSWWEDFKAYSGIKPANTDQINFIEIKHLSLTEEEYKKRMKLLNHEE